MIFIILIILYITEKYEGIVAPDDMILLHHVNMILLTKQYINDS